MHEGLHVGIWLWRWSLNYLHNNWDHPHGIGPPVSGNRPVETVSLWNDWLVHISDFQRQAVVFEKLAKSCICSLPWLCPVPLLNQDVYLFSGLRLASGEAWAVCIVGRSANYYMLVKLSLSLSLCTSKKDLSLRVGTRRQSQRTFCYIL